MKTILITGCSTGVGLEIAIGAAKSGCNVYATMRNLEKSDTLKSAARQAKVSLNILELDVTKPDTIESSVAQVIRETTKIDVLVNNAGRGFARSLEQADEREIQNIFDVNFMGVMRCTKSVMPYMREAGEGHVINISSVGGLVGQPFNEIYCAAKFAVEGFTESLASYVGPAFGIHFTVVEPGGISSEFSNSVMTDIGASGGILDDPYKPLLERYISGAQARAKSAEDNLEQSIYQTPAEVAEIVLSCVKNPSPPIRLRTSKWAEDLCDLKTSNDPDGKKMQAKVMDMFMGGLKDFP